MPLYDLNTAYIQKRQSKGTKRKTRQAKALEAKKAPKTFMELLLEVRMTHLLCGLIDYNKKLF